MSEPRALLAASPWVRALPLRVALAASFATCLAGVAIVLVSRRLGGVLHQPLPTPAVISLAISVAAACTLVRKLPKDLTSDTCRWLTIALSLLSFFIAAAVSLPGTSSLSLAALWTIVVGSEVWAWRSTNSPTSYYDEPPPVVSLNSTVGEPTHHVVELDISASDEVDADEEAESDLPPENVVQQLTRERLEEGGEMLSGSLRVLFAPRERTTVAHIAFCPPFKSVPNVAAEPWDGPSASVKVVQTLPQGIRMEVKLDRESSLESSVLVAFEAISEHDPR